MPIYKQRQIKQLKHQQTLALRQHSRNSLIFTILGGTLLLYLMVKTIYNGTHDRKGTVTDIGAGMTGIGLLLFALYRVACEKPDMLEKFYRQQVATIESRRKCRKR